LGRNVLGSFALDPISVPSQDIYEAVACSWMATRETFEEVFDPLNGYIVDLFCSP